MKTSCILPASLISLGLMGCAGHTAPTEVDVPVQVHCDVILPQAPINCHSPAGQPETDAEWLKCELGLSVEYQDYSKQLEALLGICKAGF